MAVLEISFDLKQLPIRALLAYSSRCARRVQPFYKSESGKSESEASRKAIDSAIRLAEAFAAGNEVDPDVVSQIEEITVQALMAVSEPGLENRSAAYAANAAYAVISATSAAIELQNGVNPEAAANRVLEASIIATEAAQSADEAVSRAARLDWEMLHRMRLGKFPGLGESINPAESGMLGPLFCIEARSAYRHDDENGPSGSGSKSTRSPSAGSAKSGSSDGLKPALKGDNLSSQKAKLWVAKLRARKEKLETEQAAFETERNVYLSAKETFEAERESFLAERAAFAEQQSSSQQDPQSSDDERQTLQNELQAARQRLDDLEKERTELIEGQNKEEADQQNSTEISALQEALSQHQQQLEKLEQERDELIEQKAMLESTNKNREEQKAQLEAALAEQAQRDESDLEHHQVALEAERRELEERRLEFEEHASELDQKKAELTTLEEQLAVEREAIAVERQEFESRNAEGKDRRAALDAEEKRVEKQKSQLRVAAEKFKETKKKVEERRKLLMEKQKEMKAQRDELKAAAKAHKGSVQKHERETKAFEEQRSQFEKQSQEIDGRVKELQEQRDQIKQHESQLEDYRQQLQADVSVHQRDRETHEAERIAFLEEKASVAKKESELAKALQEMREREKNPTPKATKKEPSSPIEVKTPVSSGPVGDLSALLDRLHEERQQLQAERHRISEMFTLMNSVRRKNTAKKNTTQINKKSEIRKAAGKTTMSLLIEPGTAKSMQIAGLFHELSKLYRVMGGPGLLFKLGECRSWSYTKADGLHENDEVSARTFVEVCAYPDSKVRKGGGQPDPILWDRFTASLVMAIRLDAGLFDYFSLGEAIGADHQDVASVHEAAKRIANAFTRTVGKEKKAKQEAMLSIDSISQQIKQVEKSCSDLERDCQMKVELCWAGIESKDSSVTGGHSSATQSDGTGKSRRSRLLTLGGLLTAVIVAVGLYSW